MYVVYLRTGASENWFPMFFYSLFLIDNNWPSALTIFHIQNRNNIPGGNVLVESVGSIEHPTHVCDT